MRIAFYAPMKPPDHPVPSGDRNIARLFMRALADGGHRVRLASRFRSWENAVDDGSQARIERRGARLAARLIDRYRRGDRPDLWFTYHVYYKAPDWLGPAVADAFGIPYVVAEASHSPKRAGGAWDRGHRATERALRRADLIVALNPDDRICLPQIVPARRVMPLPPFLDGAPLRRAAAGRATHRAALAAAHDIDPARPWLLAAAMMRAGDKVRSYARLAEALNRLGGRPWHLLIAGDGQARAEVEAMFRPFAGGRVRFLGALEQADLQTVYAAADIFVWPAIGEALGMAMLEAQAAGVPVVASAARGVPEIVADGVTGYLVPEPDSAALATNLARLLDEPRLRQRMGRAAAARVADRHDLPGAAAYLAERLAPLVERAA